MAKPGQAGQKRHSKASAQPIRVCFFGHFRVSLGDTVINDVASRAKQPWNLLQYLMLHRAQPVTRQQLIEAIWQDGASDQPEKALKNLVYRVRSYFAAKNVPNAQQVVLYQGGNYVLNNELSWWFDFEQMDAYYQKAVSEEQPVAERLDSALQAIELYQGDFLSEQMHEDWVLPFSTHFRSRFFHCVRLALQLLAKEGRDEEIEFVCNRAISVEPYEEEFHLEYMRAMIRRDKKSTALAHYNKMSEMFFREMGVTPNEELRALYKELSSSLQTTVTDLYTIKNSLGEVNVGNDAFYCDFEVFRSLYRLEARAAMRAGQAVFLALATLTERGGASMEEGKRLTRCMGLLLSIIHMCLRRGDVVSRFSQCQYILMLPTITVENANMVMQRVKERFARSCPFEDVVLDVKVQPLDPVEEQ